MRRVARLSVLASLAHVGFSLLLGGAIIVVGLQFRSLVENAQNTIVGGLLIATGVVFAGFELTGRGHGHSHDHGHSHTHDHDGYDGHRRNGDHEHEPEHVHDHGLDCDNAGQHDHADGHEHGPVLRSDDLATRRLVGLAREGTGVSRGRVSGLASVMVPFGAAASPDLTILPVFLAATTVGVAASIGALVIFSGVTIATIVGLTLVATFGGYQIRGRWLERWGTW